MQKTPCAVWIERIQALRRRDPSLSLHLAARIAERRDSKLAREVLEVVGSWPSSDPEIRALQNL